MMHLCRVLCLASLPITCLLQQFGVRLDKQIKCMEPHVHARANTTWGDH